MYHRYSEALDAEDLGAEYIELFNRGNDPINLAGWHFGDGVTFDFPDVTLAAHGYMVVTADPEAFKALYPDLDSVLGPWVGRLGNAGERIALYDASGTLADEVRYADNGDWGVRVLGPVDYGHRGWVWASDHDGVGKSLELVNPKLPNEYGTNWKASSDIGGTPGQRNAAALDDVAPLIARVRHTPEVPGSVDSVAVTASVIDESPEGLSVRLRYRIDSSQYVASDIYPEHDPNQYRVETMFDDGVHQDGLAGDGIYGAAIPPQSHLAVVEFYVEAIDREGQTRTWPAPSMVDDQWQQVTNALYQVNDQFNPYDYWTVGGEPLYYMVMTEAERGRLAHIGDSSQDSNSRAQMNGTFISVHGDGVRCRYNVGIRNRGNGSRRYPPNNYRVNFPSDRKWKDRSAININSKYTYNQVFGNSVFHMAGLPAPRATRVQVRVNGENLSLADPTRMYGSYAHIEVYDGDWTASHLPDDSQANVYSCVSRGRYCDLEYLGEDPASYSLPDHYAKTTNESLNDYSDLIQLTYALDASPDDEYVRRVEEMVDIDQWCRWLAVEALLLNRETNLSSGYADDYYICGGVTDPRFILLPHDLDTILTGGNPNTSIWLGGRLDSLPAVKRFLTHPEFVPRYYAQLKDVAETVFAPERFNPLVDQLLGGWIPQQNVDRIKVFMAERRTYVLSTIPAEFTVDSVLDLTNDYHATYLSSVTGDDIHGTADAILTRSVLVNGRPVQWFQMEGQWSLGSVVMQLMPGINRFTVEAFDGSEGTGQRIAEDVIDIWFEDKSITSLSGSIASDRFLDAASGPWYVLDAVTIEAGVTLRIEPGTTVFFGTDAALVVAQGGRLLADGTPNEHVRFASLPGVTFPWKGITFDHTLEDNRLVYVDIDHFDDQSVSTDIRQSRVLLDHVTWGQTDTTVLALDHPRVIARDCVFPSVSRAESVLGAGLAGDEFLVLERCTFGPGIGATAVLAFSGGRRPGPVLQVYDCLFLGGRAGGLLLHGADAHIEGSTFLDCRRGQDDDSPSFAVRGDQGAEVWTIRNVFAGNDYAVLLETGSYLIAENNTLVNSGIAAVSFGTPPGEPGLGLTARGNIFWNNAAEFEHLSDGVQSTYGPAEILVDHSLLVSQWHGLGVGNLDADPLFVGSDDYHLRPASGAGRAGAWTLDMGAYVQAGAAVCGEPPAVTHRTEATLTVGGPGITHYVYSLNAPDGPWSDERSVDVPVTLSGLGDGGIYTVYVLGRNSAGRWQDHPNASRTWTVDVTYSRLVINEVLALNESAYEHEGTYPDLIELYYQGAAPMDLSGVSLSDNSDRANRFAFPDGVHINPGEYMVLLADSEQSTSGIHLGFALDGKGEEVHLYDRDGREIDSVTFGHQLPDRSIGRVHYEGSWQLTVPTFGQANVADPLGDLRRVRINEVLAGTEVSFADDFIELYNPHAWPVDIGGAFLTDDPTARIRQHEIRPLSFIADQGFVVFKADGQVLPGRAGFSLSLDGEVIGLSSADLAEVDRVMYGPQTPDVSFGRSADGSDVFDYFALPTPGLSNPERTGPGTVTSVLLVAEEAFKRVIVPTWLEQVGDGWKSDPLFDDSDWLSLSGEPGGVGYDVGQGYESVIGLDVESHMYRVNTSCYVRIPFQVGVDSLGHLSGLRLSVRYDDGFVAYLNGTEIARVNFSGTPQWDSQSSANYESLVDVFDLVLDISQYTTVLTEGNNLLAIHALNGSLASSDFLISAALEGIVADPQEGDDPYAEEFALLDGLRITELMYHAAAGEDLDYIELQNVGDVALELNGLRFTDGIVFTFGQMTLGPGEYVVVADDAMAFQAAYGQTVPLAGEYSGHLSNQGEHIVLLLPEPFEAAIMRFSYDDRWYPETDGDGQSLAIKDATAAPVTWNDPENWRASVPTPGGP